MTLDVPPKKEIIVYAPLTDKQEAFYTAVVNKTIAKVLGQEKVCMTVFSPHSYCEMYVLNAGVYKSGLSLQSERLQQSKS